MIQSEEKNLTPVEAVSHYKELMAVERALRDLKDVIEMRPIYHQTRWRVEAHIFVAALALLLQHAVQRKLKQSGPGLVRRGGAGGADDGAAAGSGVARRRRQAAGDAGDAARPTSAAGTGDPRPHAAGRPRPKTPHVVAHPEPRSRVFNHLQMFLANMG